MMKQILIGLLSLLSIAAFGALLDAKQITQTTYNSWDVECSDGTKETAASDQILKNTICRGNRSQSKSSCFKATTKGLAATSHNDRYEIDQIVKACRKSQIGTPGCILKFKEATNNLTYNDLNEALTITKSCVNASAHTPKCYELATKNIYSTNYDQFAEVSEIMNACSKITLSGIECIEFTKENLSTVYHNDRSEMISIINSCKA